MSPDARTWVSISRLMLPVSKTDDAEVVRCSAEHPTLEAPLSDSVRLSIHCKSLPPIYRVSHLVANLGWVELNLGSSLGRLAIQWVATAQAGWWNIPNPCQQNPVRDQMGHPVIP